MEPGDEILSAGRLLDQHELEPARIHLEPRRPDRLLPNSKPPEVTI
jgi:hypothetical protein